MCMIVMTEKEYENIRDTELWVNGPSLMCYSEFPNPIENPRTQPVVAYKVFRQTEGETNYLSLYHQSPDASKKFSFGEGFDPDSPNVDINENVIFTAMVYRNNRSSARLIKHPAGFFSYARHEDALDALNHAREFADPSEGYVLRTVVLYDVLAVYHSMFGGGKIYISKILYII